mmetsp:Transcript_13824/g.41776  ORF Transcript_13824/g.41776 Transcript_13824/m.41776 type:complete len:313 (+) Transcript_13824:501-1439(+)
MLPHLLAWLQWNFAMAACWPSLVWLPTRTSLSVPRPGDLFSWRLRRKAGIALGRPPMQPLCSTPKETGPSFRCWRPAGSSCCAQTKVCPEGLSRRALHGRLPVLSLNDRAGLHDYSLNLTHRLRVHWLHMKIRLILQLQRQLVQEPGVPLDLLEGNALRGSHHEHAADEIYALLAEMKSGRNGVDCPHRPVYRSVGVPAGVFKGVAPAQHEVEDDAAGPHIGLLAVILLPVRAQHYLWGQVLHGALRTLGLRVVGVMLGEAEVTYFEERRMLRRHMNQRVLQLQVSMADTLVVAEADARHQLLEEVTCTVLS